MYSGLDSPWFDIIPGRKISKDPWGLFHIPKKPKRKPLQVPPSPFSPPISVKRPRESVSSNRTPIFSEWEVENYCEEDEDVMKIGLIRVLRSYATIPRGCMQCFRKNFFFRFGFCSRFWVNP